MSATLRALLAGLASAAAVALALSFLFTTRGASMPPVGLVLAVIIGVAIAGVVRRAGGNATERRLTDAERASALALTPPAGAALLVLVREGFVGRAIGVDVAVDGRTAVQLRSPRAAVLHVSPGAHDLSARFAIDAASPVASLGVQVAEGGVAFVRVAFAMGMARGTVTLQSADDPDRLRAALASMTLVAPSS